MSDGTCRCGHEKRFHESWKGACGSSTDGLDDPFAPGSKWTWCKCRFYDSAVLPAEGERPLFGVHRVTEAEAETAPAWSWTGLAREQTAKLRKALR